MKYEISRIRCKSRSTPKNSAERYGRERQTKVVLWKWGSVSLHDVNSLRYETQETSRKLRASGARRVCVAIKSERARRGGVGSVQKYNQRKNDEIFPGRLIHQTLFSPPVRVQWTLHYHTWRTWDNFELDSRALSARLSIVVSLIFNGVKICENLAGTWPWANQRWKRVSCRECSFTHPGCNALSHSAPIISLICNNFRGN